LQTAAAVLWFIGRSSCHDECCRAAAQGVTALEMADLELPPLGALLAEQSVPTIPTSLMPLASAPAAGCGGLWADSCIASDRSEHDVLQLAASQQIKAQISLPSDGKHSALPARPATISGRCAAVLPSDSSCTQQADAQLEQCKRPAELPLPDLASKLVGPHSRDAVPAAAAAASPALLMPAIGKDAAASPPRGCGIVTPPYSPLCGCETLS